MNLLLVSKTAIIKQIFNLVTKKINLDLTIISNKGVIENFNEESDSFDLVIIEDEFLTQDISYKNSSAKRFGIITKDKGNLKEENDFIISKPFLPSNLVTILEEQIQKLQTPVSSKEDSTKIEDTTNDAVNFIETLVEDISDEIMEETDESVVPTAFVENGGILDSNELSKIQDLLINDKIQESEVRKISEQNSDEDDWIDLANIIDKAIDEVKEYQFSVNEPIKLTLNKYSMQELSPLLNKLDQNILDALTNGEEISLQLKVEKDAN